MCAATATKRIDDRFVTDRKISLVLIDNEVARRSYLVYLTATGKDVHDGRTAGRLADGPTGGTAGRRADGPTGGPAGRRAGWSKGRHNCTIRVTVHAAQPLVLYIIVSCLMFLFGFLNIE